MCARDRANAWRLANLARASEEGKARCKAWREANPERSRAQAVAWAKANPDKMAARQKRWRQANPARVSEINRATKRKHAGRVRASNMQRYALLKSAQTVEVTAADIEAVFASTHGMCSYCPRKATAVDHIVPLSRGGAHAVHNLAPACRSCNSSKGAKLIGEWRVS